MITKTPLSELQPASRPENPLELHIHTEVLTAGIISFLNGLSHTANDSDTKQNIQYHIYIPEYLHEH